MTDAVGSIWRYEYDVLNMKVASIDPMGNTARKTYDPVGNLLTATDPAGMITR